MTNDLVSVILPTYNRANFITRAVNSVLGQSYKNLELIIIDDGSTDETKIILDKYDVNVNYIYQNNSGAASARNTGVKAAEGKYIAFIDSDDTWHSDKIEKQLKYFYKQKEIGICFTNANLNQPDGTVEKKPEFIKHTENAIFGIKEIFLDPYFGLPTVMIKKDIFSEIGLFDESLKTAEDLDLFLRAGLITKAGYIHDKLVEVYISFDSLSLSDESYEDNVFVMKRFSEKNKEYLLDHGCSINEVLFNIYYDYAKTLLWQGNKIKSREILRLADNYQKNIKTMLLYIKSFIK